MSINISNKLMWKIISTSIAVIFISIISLSFVGYKLYKNVIANQKSIIEKQAAEQIAQEQKSKEVISLQEKALTEARADLDKTKTEAKETDAKLKTLTDTVSVQAKAPKDIIISSGDLSNYVTGVAQIMCTTKDNKIISGSGTLWNFKEAPFAILTNYHVVKDSNSCVVSITNSANKETGLFSLEGTIYTFNKNTDEAVLAIGPSISSSNIPVANYNYSLGKVRYCPKLMPVGTPTVIIGFPAYSKRDSTVTIAGIGTVNTIFRTATNGIISGYDTSSQSGEANYFVSAKIDNGNSGGMALAKDSSGLCVLGLPTWLTVGNYETQGLVQNILNILPN